MKLIPSESTHRKGGQLWWCLWTGFLKLLFSVKKLPLCKKKKRIWLLSFLYVSLSHVNRHTISTLKPSCTLYDVFSFYFLLLFLLNIIREAFKCFWLFPVWDYSCHPPLHPPTPCRNFQTNKSFQNANFSTLIIMLYLMVCILPYFRMGMCFKSHKEKWLISYFLIHLILWPDPRMSNLSPLSHADLPKAVWSAWSKSRSVWSASFTLDIALMNEIPQQCLHRHLGISLSKHTHNSLSPTQKGISAIPCLPSLTDSSSGWWHLRNSFLSVPSRTACSISRAKFQSSIWKFWTLQSFPYLWEPRGLWNQHFLHYGNRKHSEYDFLKMFHIIVVHHQTPQCLHGGWSPLSMATLKSTMYSPRKCKGRFFRCGIDAGMLTFNHLRNLMGLDW